METKAIGLIGAGLLGSALAERMLHAGLAVIGYDIDSRRRELLRAAGAVSVDSAHDVAARCRRVVLSLPTSDEVEAVVDQIEGVLEQDALVIDTTTGEPDRTAMLGARLAARGVGYVDATVSGSSAQARACDVVVMAGGQPAAVEACEDLFACFARRWFHVGPCGSGARMKLVANLVLGLNRAALAEGLSLAKAIGLEPPTALEVLKEGAAYSRAMDTKGEKMVRGDFSPQARLSQHLKDVRLILASAAKAGIDLPLSSVHQRLLEQVEAAGFGAADNSAVIKAFE